jgi:hypothetical protein
MSNNYLVTYCDDLAALQLWLADNVDNSRVSQARGLQGELGEFVIVNVARRSVIKNDDSTKTMSFVVASNDDKSFFESSPIEIIGQGLAQSEPYDEILASVSGLEKYRSIISLERQNAEFGGDFNFCRV